MDHRHGCCLRGRCFRHREHARQKPRRRRSRSKLSIPNLLYAAMPTIKVNNYAGQNDKKHYTGNRRPHVGVSRLQLITKECSKEEGAENIGGEIWSGESSLGCINQFEGVEISY